MKQHRKLKQLMAVMMLGLWTCLMLGMAIDGWAATCLKFDGIDGYVEIPAVGTGVLGDNSANEDFTLEARFFWLGGGSGGHHYFKTWYRGCGLFSGI